MLLACLLAAGLMVVQASSQAPADASNKKTKRHPYTAPEGLFIQVRRPSTMPLDRRVLR
jgi:hypothetical protein